VSRPRSSSLPRPNTRHPLAGVHAPVRPATRHHLDRPRVPSGPIPIAGPWPVQPEQPTHHWSAASPDGSQKCRTHVSSMIAPARGGRTARAGACLPVATCSTTASRSATSIWPGPPGGSGSAAARSRVRGHYQPSDGDRQLRTNACRRSHKSCRSGESRSETSRWSARRAERLLPQRDGLSAAPSSSTAEPGNPPPAAAPPRRASGSSVSTRAAAIGRNSVSCLCRLFRGNADLVDTSTVVAHVFVTVSAVPKMTGSTRIRAESKEALRLEGQAAASTGVKR